MSTDDHIVHVVNSTMDGACLGFMHGSSRIAVKCSPVRMLACRCPDSGPNHQRYGAHLKTEPHMNSQLPPMSNRI